MVANQSVVGPNVYNGQSYANKSISHFYKTMYRTNSHVAFCKMFRFVFKNVLKALASLFTISFQFLLKMCA